MNNELKAIIDGLTEKERAVFFEIAQCEDQGADTDMGPLGGIGGKSLGGVLHSLQEKGIVDLATPKMARIQFPGVYDQDEEFALMDEVNNYLAEGK